MDGWITIGTKLDTNTFDKQITQLEKKMQKEEEKKIQKEVEISDLKKSINQYDEAEKKVVKLTQRLEDLRAERQRIMQQGDFKFVTPQGTVGFSNEYKDVEGEIQKANTDLVKQTEIINSQGGSIDKNRAKLESMKQKHDEISQKASEYKQKIESLKIQQQVAEVDRMKDSFKNVGSSIQTSINKVARLALGIFGIRTAYNLLRQASSELASYDQQYATNLEYIRYVLTQAIAPVLRYIVGLAMQLLSYINAIANGWFGINLFGNASAKSFQKMKAGAGGVSKAVKEIKKELAGFDEINILSDQSSGGAGGGGGVGGAMPDFDLSSLAGEVPDWLQFIIDHRNEILAIMAGIAAGLLAWRLGLEKINPLGIGIMIAGVVYAIMSLIDYLNDPSWTNFGKVIQGIGVAVIGLGVVIASVPVAVAGAAVLVVGIIIKYWEQIRAFIQSGIDWLKERSDWIHNVFGDTIGTIYDSFVHSIQAILNWFNTLFTSMKNILDGIIKVVKGVFTGNWAMAWEGVKQIFTNALEIMKQRFIVVVNVLGDIANAGGAVIKGIFRGVINGVLSLVQGGVNLAIRGINGIIGAANIIPGVNIGKIPSISLPRLKVGGIINMPNRGTMVGGAIAGESGAEGVVPLTDSQAMAELGREIGKNVLINLTNVTTMNGRVINRQLRQVKSNQEFAYNT